MAQPLIALDQLINTLAGGFADETISARAWRRRKEPRWGAIRRGIDTLFFWQPNHCEQSFISEVRRKHLPKAYR